VEETNCLVAENLKVTSKERFLFEHCKEFLSSLAAMQVKHVFLKLSNSDMLYQCLFLF